MTEPYHDESSSDDDEEEEEEQLEMKVGPFDMADEEAAEYGELDWRREFEDDKVSYAVEYVCRNKIVAGMSILVGIMLFLMVLPNHHKNNGKTSPQPQAQQHPQVPVVTPAPSALTPKSAPSPARQQQTPAPTVASTVRATAATRVDMDHLIVEGLPPYTLHALQQSAWSQTMAYSWVEQHPQLEAMEEWRKLQLFGLATFYYAFNGHSWVAQKGNNVADTTVHWLSYDVPECQWGGTAVSCNKDGVFGRLSLQHVDNVQGTMPPEIALLSRLGTLVLYETTHLHASLDSLIPTEMGTMTQLSALTITKSAITGSIPSTIGLLTALKRLDCRNNVLVGTLPEELGLLTQLTHLELSSNRIGGSIPAAAIAKLDDLRLLDLQTNMLMGPLPTELGLLTKLTKLQVQAPYDAVMQQTAGITGTLPTELGLCSLLTFVELKSNRLEGVIPTELGVLTKLNLLRLDANDLTGTVPEQVCQLESLKNFLLDCRDYESIPDGCDCKDGATGAKCNQEERARRRRRLL